MKIFNTNEKVTDHFTGKELFCKSFDFKKKSHELSDVTIKGLEFIRCFYNEPLIIDSTLRTPAGNLLAGGADKSYHLTGQAIDFRAQNHPSEFVQKVFKDYHDSDSELKGNLDFIGVKTLIFYDHFIHIDDRQLGYTSDYRTSQKTLPLVLLILLFLIIGAW